MILLPLIRRWMESPPQLVGESPETNVFQYLEEDLPAWTRVRKIIVSIIMHTDMIHHFNMVRYAPALCTHCRRCTVQSAMALCCPFPAVDG
jgi:hypothetical protein